MSVSYTHLEVRYLSVQKAFPKEADELFSQAEKMAKLRYQTYVRKSQEDWSCLLYTSCPKMLYLCTGNRKNSLLCLAQVFS